MVLWIYTYLSSQSSYWLAPRTHHVTCQVIESCNNVDVNCAFKQHISICEWMGSRRKEKNNLEWDRKREREKER